MDEKGMKNKLRKYFRERMKSLVLKNEFRLPIKKGHGLSCQPDFIAYEKKANLLYMIECKKGRSSKTVGHAFGQMLATKITLRDSTDKNKLIERLNRHFNLEDHFDKKKLKNLKIIFGVAFLKEKVKSNPAMKHTIGCFVKEEPFKNFSVYYTGKTVKIHCGGRRESLYLDDLD